MMIALKYWTGHLYYACILQNYKLCIASATQNFKMAQEKTTFHNSKSIYIFFRIKNIYAEMTKLQSQNKKNYDGELSISVCQYMS